MQCVFSNVYTELLRTVVPPYMACIVITRFCCQTYAVFFC